MSKKLLINLQLGLTLLVGASINQAHGTYPIWNTAENLEQFNETHNAIRLNNMQIVEFPQDLLNHPRLELIDVSRNELRELPADIHHLKNLMILDIGYNKIENLPQTLGRLNHLDRINLEENQFKTFPACLLNMHSLKYINLYNNHLTALPDRITELSNLRFITLNKNKFPEGYFRDRHSLCVFLKIAGIMIENEHRRDIEHTVFNMTDEYLLTTIRAIYGVLDPTRAEIVRVVNTLPMPIAEDIVPHLLPCNIDLTDNTEDVTMQDSRIINIRALLQERNILDHLNTAPAQ